MATGWGIVGTGVMAGKMAQALARVDGAELVAVASRSPERALPFAAGGRVRACSLDELLADPAVDVVHVASPHSEHRSQTVQALRAGKHVLVEKPAALSLEQTSEMLRVAEQSDRLLLEAMWTRFLPAYDALRELVATGAIGEVLEVHADQGTAWPFVPEHRLYRRDLGGGALLDIGVYPLQLALMLLGTPEHVSATAELGPTGVDHDTRVELLFAAGRRATARCSLVQDLPGTARVVGSGGWVELAGPSYAPESLTYGSGSAAPVRLDTPVDGDGWRFQAEAVQQCLADGLQQSPLMTWADSLLLAQTVDLVRAEIGLVHLGT